MAIYIVDSNRPGASCRGPTSRCAVDIHVQYLAAVAAAGIDPDPWIYQCTRTALWVGEDSVSGRISEPYLHYEIEMTPLPPPPNRSHRFVLKTHLFTKKKPMAAVYAYAQPCAYLELYL